MWYNIHIACFYWFLSLFVGFMVLMRIRVQFTPIQRPLLEGVLLVTYSLFLATALLYTLQSKDTPRLGPEERADITDEQKLNLYEGNLKVEYGLHFTYLPCIYLSKLLLLVIFAKYTAGNRMARAWIYVAGIAVIGSLGFEFLLPLLHCKVIPDNWSYKGHNSCLFNEKTAYVSISLHLGTNFLLLGIGLMLLCRILPYFEDAGRKRAAKFMFAIGTIFVIFSIVYAGFEINLAKNGNRSKESRAYRIIMDLVLSIHQALPIVIICMPQARIFFMRQWDPRPDDEKKKPRNTEVREVNSAPLVAAQAEDVEANAADSAHAEGSETSSTLTAPEGNQEPPAEVVATTTGPESNNAPIANDIDQQNITGDQPTCTRPQEAEE